MRITPCCQDGTGVRKDRIQRKVGIQSYEVVTEDGGVYPRNRRHLRKTNEATEDWQRGSHYSQNDQETQIVIEQTTSASGLSNRVQKVDQHHPVEDPEGVEQRAEFQTEAVTRTRSGRII